MNAARDWEPVKARAMDFRAEWLLAAEHDLRKALAACDHWKSGLRSI